MKARVAGLVAMTAVPTLGAAPGRAPAIRASSPRRSRFARRDGNHEVYVMNAEGS